MQEKKLTKKFKKKIERERERELFVCEKTVYRKNKEL